MTPKEVPMLWIIEHVFGFLYNKIIGVPVKGLFNGVLKLGYMLRKGVEVKKLHIYEDDAQANRCILIPFSVWAFLGILVWLLVILLGVPIIYPLVGWLSVTGGIVAGYLNLEVSEDMKKLQIYRKDIKGQNSNKPFVYALLIVGLVCIGIGFYQLFSKGVLHNAEQIVFVPFTEPASAAWDEYGPGYDGPSLSQATQFWMRKTGIITYSVPIGNTLLQGDNIEISVTLSSELEKTTSSNILFSSDVILIVNGVEQPPRNVIPDDAQGKRYTWNVLSKLFMPNQQNSIAFAVKNNAFYKNGLCIYSPIELRFY